LLWKARLDPNSNQSDFLFSDFGTDEMAEAIVVDKDGGILIF
jgi:hypothetical protein